LLKLCGHVYKENYYRKAIELDLADEQIGEEDKQALYSRAVKCYHKAASLGELAFHALPPASLSNASFHAAVLAEGSLS